MREVSKKLIIFLLPLILLYSCTNATGVNIDYENILVRVNDDFIYRERVDLVYIDFEGTVTYERIVMDSILELLVVQKSPYFGISLSEEELQGMINLFEEMEPEFFYDAIETFGIYELREKLRIRNLFSMTKDYVIENVLFPYGEIPTEATRRFIDENNLTEQLAHFTYAQILNDLGIEVVEFTFRRWMEGLKANADIGFIGFSPS
ncbi:MAG: hypothetical protein FWC91_05030 [Defluviitaleaceae bacterium]|nr:hypothetical protein [Defluviitaleaceae bacterium]